MINGDPTQKIVKNLLGTSSTRYSSSRVEYASLQKLYSCRSKFIYGYQHKEAIMNKSLGFLLTAKNFRRSGKGTRLQAGRLKI
jgi:hypothetical protein